MGNFFQKVDFFLKKPLVWGSFAAGGRCFFQKFDSFLEEATSPGQLRCLGQNCFFKIRLKTTVDATRWRVDDGKSWAI